MEYPQENKKSFKEKLTYKYRFVILNEDTFEERFSFKLNRLNAFVLTGLFSILLVITTAIIIAFTPMKEYIPGYASTSFKKNVIHLIYKNDSLATKVNLLENYVRALKPILTGTISGEEIDSKFLNKIAKKQLEKQQEEEQIAIENKTSQADSLLREEVEREDRFSLFESAQRKSDIVFFAPVTGIITEKFNTKNKHFAVDIAIKKGTPVKAAASGTVLFSEWTVETGYVIILKHNSGFISAYKHNQVLLKEQGDLISSGEVIAMSGATGDHSTGPHLHFELWNEGFPVNPTDFIDFE